MFGMNYVSRQDIAVILLLGRYLTPSQAAGYLAVTTKTLADYRSKGRLPRYIKRGNAIRYPADAIIEFIVERNKAKYMPIYDELLRSTLEHGT